MDTRGATDVVLSAYGPDSGSTLVAADSDSGQGTNARIVRKLAPGRYVLRVGHQNGGTGGYDVGVRRYHG
jgi:hypothetical protein